MRPFRAYSLLFWGLLLVVGLAHLGYLAHFWGWSPAWDVIHAVGHASGWLGAGLMLLSLLYLARKRRWFARGKVRFWYRFHVVTGLAGPLLILLHAYGKYFGFGGLALACLWLVLLTGVIGHFLFRRLPDELRERVQARQALLERQAEIATDLTARFQEYAELRERVSTTGLLARLVEAERTRLPRATLARNPSRLWSLWRERRASRRELAHARREVTALFRTERRSTEARERELLELLSLEHDTRELATLNELFSLWRTLHVPLSWLLWWLLGLHLFGWVYY